MGAAPLQAVDRPAPCRVVQVVTSVCAGGLSRYLLNLLDHVDPARVEMHLICTHFEGPHLQHVRGRVASLTVFSARSQAEKLRRLVPVLRRLRPAAVQCHQEPAGLIAGALAGVPRRLDTIHMAEYWLADGHPLLRRCAGLAATAHVVCTEAEGARIRPAAAAGKIRVVNPGYDFSNLAPGDRWGVRRELGIPENAFLVGTVSRLDPEKGVRHLLEAAPGILAALPEARLLLVGDGGEAETLRALAERLGVAERVVFAGYRADAQRLLGALDVFVMASLTESWGFAVIEAMAAGLPVVCTRTAGPSSFLEHGRTGLMVPAADPGAIAEAVIALAEAGTRDEMGARAAAAIRQRVSMQRFTAEYERLYGLVPEARG